MRLKRVRVFGFKTFADRTEFSLEGGVIAVVGPNGCGKSNLVDAILWGLGEGNARNLRAAHNQDVIFSGSSTRKPVGFAEVTLLFDNDDNALPMDTAEVSVTRRLTRAGDSEYTINRQQCRLRDVYDLLADSGLGRAGYAIVGQKEIDAALSASAEERRGWIDEAAGVQRYRARKVESARRLATAAEHLARVSDILNELESQREPLREEAEVARRHKALTAALRDVEIGMLVEEVGRAISEIADLELRIQESRRVSEAEQARADSLEAEAQRTKDLIARVEVDVEELRALHQDSRSAVARAEANLQLLQQRREGLDEQERLLSEEAESVAARITESERELAQVLAEYTAEASALEALRDEMSGVGEEAERLKRALDKAELVLAEGRRRHGIRLRQEAERTHGAARIAQIRREVAGIEGALPELEAAIQEAQAALNALTGRRDAGLEAMKTGEARMREVRRAEDRDSEAVRTALAERASLEGRKRGIEATIDAHEGLNQGSRAVLEAVDRGLIQGEYLPVGLAVETDKRYAVAIDTALGASANDLICDDSAQAKSAIEWLKQHRAGRATFQPIPLMRPSEPGADLRRLLNERGVVGRASELVKGRSKYRPVIDSLLGRVVVVEDLDVALRLARTTGWSRLVTLDGEVVHSGGAVTGGQASRQAYGLVQRKADVAELDEQLVRVEQTVGQFQTRQKGRARELEQCEGGIRAAREAIAAEETELTEARNFHQALIDEQRSTERSREKLIREIEALQTPPTDIEAPVDLPGLEASRDEAIRALAGKSADAEQAEARLRESELRVQQSQARCQTAERRLHLMREAQDNRQRKLDNLEPERARIAAEETETEVGRAAAAEATADAEARLERAQNERRYLMDAVAKFTEEAREARGNVSVSLDAARFAEIGMARAESRRASAVQRLTEEYALTEEDAISRQGRYEVPPDATALVQRLRRDIRAMGDVNTGAIEAFERLTARFEELEAQRADVMDGIAQVEAGIRELDKLTRDRFLRTFSAVEVAFAELFQRLFGGGEGKLAMTDAENVLDSGIELLITLPGKRRQALALLSGGERALSAVAFLFALLKVKPSPLVVLDEVDAPLDGRNVERFGEMLLEFARTIQFIVITHNPTTIEMADVMLGVSMQEPGVSVLLPVRLPVRPEGAGL